MSRCLALLLLVLLQVSGSITFAKDVDETWHVTTLEQGYSVPTGQDVRVSNPFGEILVRSSDTPEVKLHASVQRHVDDPRQPRLEVDTSQGLELKVIYPEDIKPPRDAWRKRRIDLTVFVPTTSRLRLETLHERLRAQGEYPVIEAFSESGDIEIRSSGGVQARSHHGKVWVRVLDGHLEPHSLTTVTGEIRLDVPWDATFLAHVETRGEIASDFSIDITWLPGSQMKQGKVLIRETGSVRESEPTLNLRSDRGNLRLLRQIRPTGLP